MIPVVEDHGLPSYHLEMITLKAEVDPPILLYSNTTYTERSRVGNRHRDSNGARRGIEAAPHSTAHTAQMQMCTHTHCTHMLHDPVANTATLY